MQSRRKSMANVTKLGRNQRALMVVFWQKYPMFLNRQQLLLLTGLREIQVSSSLRPLVVAKLVECVWSEDGRDVYRLIKKGK